MPLSLEFVEINEATQQKLLTYYNLAESYLLRRNYQGAINRFTSSLVFCNKIIKTILANKLSNEILLCYCHHLSMGLYRLGYTHFCKEDYKNAIRSLSKAVKLAKSMQRQYQEHFADCNYFLALSLSNHGYEHAKENRHKKAISYFSLAISKMRLAVEYFQEKQFEDELDDLYRHLAIAQTDCANEHYQALHYHKAMALYSQAEKTRKDVQTKTPDDEKAIAVCRGNLLKPAPLKAYSLFVESHSSQLRHTVFFSTSTDDMLYHLSEQKLNHQRASLWVDKSYKAEPIFILDHDQLLSATRLSSNPTPLWMFVVILVSKHIERCLLTSSNKKQETAANAHQRSNSI